ncbi:MAG: radical SAM protein [Halobacteriota archaeon]
MFKRLFSYLTLQIEPTRKCNLNCKMCMRNNLEGPVGSLSLDNFKEIVDSYNFRYVALHGWGEPLLNREVFEMIKYAEAKGVHTNLTTNGTLIEENIGNVFDSGLREIAFGIYDKDALLKFIPKLEKLMSKKAQLDSKTPKTYLDITIYAESYDEIPDMIKLAKEAGIDAVILHRLFNVYNVDPDVKYVSKNEEERLFHAVNELKKELKFEIYLPKRHSLPCRIVKYSVFVTYDGKLTPCCFLPEFSMGNVLESERGIGDILRSQEYRGFIKNMGVHPVCGKCGW